MAGGSEIGVAARAISEAMYSRVVLDPAREAPTRGCTARAARGSTGPAPRSRPGGARPARRRRTPAPARRSDRARNRSPRSPRPARASSRRRTGLRALRHPPPCPGAGCRGGAPRGDSSRSASLPRAAAADPTATLRSLAGTAPPRDSGTGPGRAAAGAAASGASRRRDGPRGRRQAPRRSGSPCFRRPPPARARRARRPASGRRCCACARRPSSSRSATGGIRGSLERARGNDDLPGDVGAITELHHEAVIAGADGQHLAAELDRQVEVLRVAREVLDDLVTAGIGIGIARKREPRQAVVPRRGEQLQRVPPCPPRRGRLRRRLEDHEAAALTRAGSTRRRARPARPRQR